MENGLRFRAEEKLTAEGIIEALGLVPLPEEGGRYRCVYTGKKDEKGRPAYSSIYYLLTEQSFSHMHRLKTDELYHYYMGDGLELLLLYPDGRVELSVLGPDVLNGEKPQVLAPAGVWQGSRIVRRLDAFLGYCLAGTTMAPAYQAEDYEHGDRERLCRAYPEAEGEIRRRCGAVKDR